MGRAKHKPARPSERPYYKRHIGANEARYRTRVLNKLRSWRVERPEFWWRERSIWQRLAMVLCAIVIAVVSISYGIAQWYIKKHAHEPLVYGVTFIPEYAKYYGLDPQETMQAMIDDLQMRRFRLVSYWSTIQPYNSDTFDFTQLDWQFQKAQAAGAKVSLAIGLRQPRWPECHWPAWAQQLPKDQWRMYLNTYMKKVVDRYKNHPSLESYQLENEYFLSAFGVCPDHERQRLIDEFNMVKQLDPAHPIVISRSNNAVPSWPIGQPRPDYNGAAIYKRVWDKLVVKRYFEYPVPAWFYAFLSGGAELSTGRSSILHELQAEPWLPPDMSMRTSSIEEQNKSMDANRLRSRLEYGRATGMRTIDLWGAEWWYWRKVKHNDPSLWNVMKEEMQRLHDSRVYDR